MLANKCQACGGWLQQLPAVCENTILVDNDDVEVTNGDNTLLVQGKGSDDIRLGTGSDMVIVEKTGGSISIARIARNNRRPEKNKPKRIVYKGYEQPAPELHRLSDRN